MIHFKVRDGRAACRPIRGDALLPRKVTCRACKRTAAFRTAMLETNACVAGPAKNLKRCTIRNVDVEGVQIGGARQLRLYLEDGTTMVVAVSGRVADQIKRSWRT